jgi:hypothetical protein
MTGGIYKFRCAVHGTFEKFCWNNDMPNVCCATCGKIAPREAPPVQQGFHPLLSDAMGVHPSQVAEHRAAHPDIPMTDDGRVVIRSAKDNERICKKLGPGWEPTK